MGILTEDAACNLRGDIVIFTLFVIVIFACMGMIPTRNERVAGTCRNGLGA